MQDVEEQREDNMKCTNPSKGLNPPLPKPHKKESFYLAHKLCELYPFQMISASFDNGTLVASRAALIYEGSGTFVIVGTNTRISGPDIYDWSYESISDEL